MRRGWVIAVLGLLLWGTPAQADRTRGGHRFLPCEAVAEPWSVTRFDLTTGVGLASISMPEVGTLRAGSFSETARAQFRIWDQLAVRAGVRGGLLAGINAPSALLFGATGSYNFESGAIYGVDLGDRVRVSLSLDTNYGPSYNLSAIHAINESLEAMQVRAGGLLTRSQQWSVTSGAQLALGLHPAIGLVSSIDGSYARTRSESMRAVTYSAHVAAAVSIDVAGWNPNLPLGLVTSYRLGLSDTEGSRAIHEFGAAVLYSGRENLSLGLEASTFRQTYAEASLRSISGVFRMRYYW